MAVIVDARGVTPFFNPPAVLEHANATSFCWLDICGGDDTQRTDLLAEMGLEETDIIWVQRFGQAGRLAIGRQRLRAVTWLADPPGKLIEVHLLCSHQRILTVWRGDPADLDPIREHFVERIGEVGKSPYLATGILLQLLLGTLDHAIRRFDAQLEQLRVQLDDGTISADYARLANRRQQFHSTWIGFDRYASAVRSAMVGIEDLPGMDARGAEELNDYADEVDDFQGQVQERRRRMSDILHDAANAIAQRQGEQINRLTLVSLIFLPITAVTGFFGMNFAWMTAWLQSEAAFFTLGVMLPTLMMLLTLGWFIQRGFIKIGRGQPGHPPAEADGEKDKST